MFSADLSWTDNTDTKVKERSERKGRAGPIASSTRNEKPVRSDNLAGHSSRYIKLKKSITDLNPLNLNPRDALPAVGVLDQSLDSSQDGMWRHSYQQTRPILPLHGTYLTRYKPPVETHVGSKSTASNRQENIIDQVHELQRLSLHSFISRTTTRTEEILPEGLANLKSGKKCVGFTGAPSLRIQRSPLQSEAAKKLAHHQVSSSMASATTNASWKPPSDWDVGTLMDVPSHRHPNDINAPALDYLEDIKLKDLTPFQRFIRRMENATPKLILDRLKEDWSDTVNEEADEELQLEKRLWVLTALHLRLLLKSEKNPQAAFSPLLLLPTSVQKRSILELYGDLAEVYRLSAMHPKETIHYYFSTPEESFMQLPDNVSSTPAPRHSPLPLPYPSSSFDYIRASSLPALLTSNEIVAHLCECYRILMVGGIIELRLMDPTPIRQSMGPKTAAWFDKRLLTSLEKHSRCTRPLTLLPALAKEAGFTLLYNPPSPIVQSICLPAAYDPGSGSLESELTMCVARTLWKDLWGEFAEDKKNKGDGVGNNTPRRWWWEEEEILAECLEYNTLFMCGSLFAFKE